MKLMFLFCMARVAVAVAGLAVMAYVALGCTWAAIEETVPLSMADTGSCLRVEYPLIEPGPCSEVGIQHVAEVKFTVDGADARWHNTERQIPESEWWWVAPKGAGYTIVRTADLNGFNIDPTDLSPHEPAADNSIRITRPAGTTLAALSRNTNNELLIWVSDPPVTDDTITIYRFVTAPATPE